MWVYPGVNTFQGGGDLALHPTVKPVALVADAIKDVTRRGAAILDPFSGSGTTLLACEKTDRIARVLELDPTYVDVAIRRWQDFTGRDAILDTTGETWAEAKVSRAANADLEEAA